jgi:DNA-binding transcriptional ArsR family regulator
VYSVEAKVLSHPLRVQILAELAAQPSTVVDLADFLEQSLSKVMYHTTVLCRTDYVQPAEGQDPDAVNPVYEVTRI